LDYIQEIFYNLHDVAHGGDEKFKNYLQCLTSEEARICVKIFNYKDANEDAYQVFHRETFNVYQ